LRPRRSIQQLDDGEGLNQLCDTTPFCGRDQPPN
jgi:hypothetical protein